ncbi:hypothetical protein ACOMHN_067171 [Nucella lapillus]
MDDKDLDVASYERLANDVYMYGSVSMALAMATETGMIQCLCTADSPLSSAEVATQLKLKERYTRELLNSLTVAGLVQLEAGTGGKEGREARYRVPPTSGHRQALQKASTYTRIVSNVAQNFANVRPCFDQDGPLCYRYKASTFALMDKIVHQKQDMFSDAVLETPGLKQRLEKGIRALDVGCGTGRLPLYIAAMFPNSHFTLSDVVPEPLETARQLAEKEGLTNVSFQVIDVCHAQDDLTESFDLVTCRNVIHDLPYPGKALKEVCKMLKPGGHFSMLDMFTSSYVAENAKSFKVAAAMYAESAFKCIPESYQQPDSAALGNCWGIEKATELVEAAGMRVLGLKRLTQDLRCAGLCMCQKPE